MPTSLEPNLVCTSNLILTPVPFVQQASVDNEVRVFRLRTVETFLMSGTPLQRLEYFKPLLERNGYALTDHSHMRSYIPKIEATEFHILSKEIHGQFLSVAFDGTTRLGEAINITGRWCDADFKIQNRLLRFLTAKHHFKAPQCASMITRVLCTDLRLDPDFITCFSRDSVSVNGATCRLLCSSIFYGAENMLCICHTLNNVGGQLSFDVLASFMTPWLELVGGRHPHNGARELWKQTVAPQRVPGFSNTRWYSKAEIAFVLGENFDRLPGFMQQLDEYGYGDASRKKLHSFFEDGGIAFKLKLQLAAMLDLRNLVRTTYELEGDRLELLLVYQRVKELRAFGRCMRSNAEATVLPNVDAALRASVKLSAGRKISKHFAGFGFCEGKIVATGSFDSTLYPGTTRTAYTIKYTSDGTTEDLEEEEVRPLLVIADMPERAEIIDGILPAFDYLERRITGECDAPYDCAPMYEVSHAET